MNRKIKQMNEAQILDIIESMIPQYYRSSLAGAENVIKYILNGKEFNLHASRTNTPKLNRLKEFVENNIDSLLNYNAPSLKSNIESIEATVVKEWLRIKGFDANWFEMFEYLDRVTSRTNENLHVGINFIYNQNECGKEKIFNLGHDKIMDILSDSRYTYFKIGKNYTYLDYKCIQWNDIKNPVSYSQIPQFLQPYASILESTEECAITMTRLGDIIIYSKSSIFASKRKGRWTIYEDGTLKNCFVDALAHLPGKNSYWIACNIFDLVWDISYRRHGALLIIKPQSLPILVNNTESIIESAKAENIRFKMKEALKRIDLSSKENSYKPIILELASIDGAIIFDECGKIEAFGAIVQTHPKANHCLGARTTGAMSALEHGYIPIKVSSDGDISLYKIVRDKCGNEETIELNFT